MAGDRLVVRIAGLAVAVVAAGLLSFFNIASLVLAIVVGLLVIAIALLVELVMESESARRGVDDVVSITEQMRTDVFTATSLTEQIVRNEQFVSSLQSITTSLSAISRNATARTVFVNEAERSVSQCAWFLTQLANGDLTLEDPRRIEAMIALLEGALRGETVSMTSYVAMDQWWDLPLGRQYYQANKRAADRGVRIHRIFIVRPADAEKMRAFVEEQTHIFDVGLVAENLVDALHRENFFLLGSRIVSYAEYSWDGRLTKGHICTAGPKLSEYREKFDALKLLAVPYDLFYAGD
ncbi:MAG TPA: hypothetical protein VE953_06375 [Terriglobales bacterium]|nr:hypothetical protein [Terriglobales bacterium]